MLHAYSKSACVHYSRLPCVFTFFGIIPSVIVLSLSLGTRLFDHKHIHARMTTQISLDGAGRSWWISSRIVFRKTSPDIILFYTAEVLVRATIAGKTSKVVLLIEQESVFFIEVHYQNNLDWPIADSESRIAMI